MSLSQHLDDLIAEVDVQAAAVEMKIRDIVAAQWRSKTELQQLETERARLSRVRTHALALKQEAEHKAQVTIMEDPVDIDRVAAAAQALAS
jgi:hypothetical protein